MQVVNVALGPSHPHSGTAGVLQEASQSGATLTHLSPRWIVPKPQQLSEVFKASLNPKASPPPTFCPHLTPSCHSLQDLRPIPVLHYPPPPDRVSGGPLLVTESLRTFQAVQGGFTGTQSRKNRDFSGGPVAKTLRSQCRRPGFHPWFYPTRHN